MERNCEIAEFIKVIELIDAEKFYAETFTEPNSGCWLWAPGSVSHGYREPTSRVLKGPAPKGWARGLKIHRASWILKNKTPIERGNYICHKCDTTICINPDHLFSGSPKENMRDMHQKGRANTSREIRGKRLWPNSRYNKQ